MTLAACLALHDCISESLYTQELNQRLFKLLAHVFKGKKYCGAVSNLVTPTSTKADWHYV